MEPDAGNYKLMIIFCYSTEHLPQKDKVRFYYALKGRDGKSGIVKSYQINQLGRTVLLVPSKFSNEVNQFLLLWRCNFKKLEAMIKK